MKWFRKKEIWEIRNPKKALKALQALQQTLDRDVPVLSEGNLVERIQARRKKSAYPNVLAEVVMRSNSAQVILAALEKIQDQDVLESLAGRLRADERGKIILTPLAKKLENRDKARSMVKSWLSEAIKWKPSGMVSVPLDALLMLSQEDLLHFAFSHGCDNFYKEIISLITDQDMFVKYLKSEYIDECFFFKNSIDLLFDKITDRNLLLEIAGTAVDEHNRIRACERLGGHDWDGCVCRYCGKEHDWDGCVCKRCGEKTNRNHNVGDNCVCKRCGATSHWWKWVLVNNGETIETIYGKDIISQPEYSYCCHRCGITKDEPDYDDDRYPY